MRHFLLASVLLILVAPTTGQSRGPTLSFSLAGPATWRQRVLPTNFGALWEDRRAVALRTLLRDAARKALRDSDAEDHRQLFQDAEKHLLGFCGRIEVEVTLPTDSSNLSGHILLRKDGSDSPARARVLTQLLGAFASQRAQAVQVGGQTLQVFGGPISVTSPWEHGGDLVLFFGPKIDAAIARGRERVVAQPHDTAANAPLLRASYNLAHLHPWIRSQVSSAEERKRIDALFGTKSWQLAEAVFDTVGPRLQLELTATAAAGTRGVFEGLLPQISKLPRTLQLAPPTSKKRPPGYIAGHVRLQPIFASYLTLLSNLRFFGKPKTKAELRAQARQELGFDLEKDLFAHLATDWIGLVEPPVAGAVADPAQPPLDGACIAIAVKDDATFGATFAKLRGSPALRAGPERDVGNFKATPVRMFVKDEYLARLPGLLVYAVGERGLKSLISLAARRANPTAIQLPKRTPPGCNLAATVPLQLFTERFGQSILWEVWCEFRRELPPAARPSWTRDEFDEHVATLLPTLTKRGFDRIDILGAFQKTAKNSVSKVRIRW